MSLFQDQEFISKQQPMPVDDMSTSSSVQSITGETVALYYSNSGTRTIDAGQAAGTAVMGQLANKNILDSNGSYIGTWKDTSIAFTGDCFTTERAFPEGPFKDIKYKSWASKLSAVTSGFANGEYCIDYRSGTFYGKKATTTSSLTSTSYKINQGQSGSTGSSGSSSSIQSQGVDATGQDTYATIKTPSANATHVYISLEGSNAAIISFDAGTTDHVTVPAGSIIILDAITITSGVAIQAKNRTPGSNYTNLNISVW